MSNAISILCGIATHNGTWSETIFYDLFRRLNPWLHILCHLAIVFKIDQHGESSISEYVCSETLLCLTDSARRVRLTWSGSCQPGTAFGNLPVILSRSHPIYKDQRHVSEAIECCLRCYPESSWLRLGIRQYAVPINILPSLLITLE